MASIYLQRLGTTNVVFVAFSLLFLLVPTSSVVAPDQPVLQGVTGSTLSVGGDQSSGPVTGYKCYVDGTFVEDLISTQLFYNFTLTGLTASTAYSITITAVQTSSESIQSSALVASTNAATVPGACSPPTFTEKFGTKVDVNWVAPSDQGGDAVTEYELYMTPLDLSLNPTGSASLLYTGPDLKFTATGLTKDTNYGFVVNSSNTVGYGIGSTQAVYKSLSETPRVFSIKPTEGLTDEKTLVTITGEFFGTAQGDIKTVSVAGFTCTLTMQWVSSSLINCQVGPYSSFSGPIIITTTVQGPTTSAQFDFKSPQPTPVNIFPAWGFYDSTKNSSQAITVTGHHFGTSSVDLVKVTVGSYTCLNPDFQSSTQVVCTVGPATKVESGLQVQVETKSLGVGPKPTLPIFAFRDPFPFVTAISPSWIWQEEKAVLTLSGVYFPTAVSDIVRCEVLGVACTQPRPVSTVNGTHIVCDMAPVKSPVTGSAAIESKVTGAGDLSYVKFEVRKATPTVESFTPLIGWTIGGTDITIRGVFLGTSKEDVSAVSIAGIECTTSLKWSSSTLISCTSPPGLAPGPVFVTTKENGKGTDSVDPFQFTPPKPTVRDFTPDHGTPLGGTSILITGEFLGTNSTDLLSIKLFGKRCASITWISTSTVVCTTPRASAGAKGGITVTTRSLRQGPVSLKEFQFDYLLPFVSSVIPSEGPMLGGTKVVLAGAHLNRVTANAGKIEIAGVPCVWIPIDTEYLVNLTTPCTTLGCQAMCQTVGAPQRVSGPVVITDVDGAKGNPSAVEFQFWAPVPTVKQVEPSIVTSAPGEKITVHGTDFAPYSDVPVTAYVGGTPCNTTTIISNTSLACITTGATNVTEGKSAQVTVKIDKQDSSNSAVITFGVLCDPPCAGNSRCIQAGQPESKACTLAGQCMCRCRHGFVPEGLCNKDAIIISPLSSTQTSESYRPDDPPVTFTVMLGTEPTATVIVAAKTNNIKEAVVKPSSHRFSSSLWSEPQTFTVIGVRDQQRDGVTPYRVDIAAVSDDPRFKDVELPTPHFDMLNVDSDPIVLDIEPKVAPMEGIPVRIRVQNLDPLDFLVKVSNLTLTPRNTTLEAIAPSNGTRYRVMANRRDKFYPLVTASPEYWISFNLPGVGNIGYYDVQVVNLANNIRSKGGILTEVLYFTDRCPSAGLWATSDGGDFQCLPCPQGGVCPGGYRIHPAEGYWNRGEDSGFVFQCTPTVRCAGGLVRNEFRGRCNPGYEGDFCGDCQFGYYPSFAICDECPGSLEMILYLCLGVFAWLFFGLTFFFLNDGAIDQLMLGFLGMQLVNLVGQGGAHWMAPWLRHVFRVVSFFAIDLKFYRFECWMDLNPMVEYAMHTFYWFFFPLTWLVLLPAVRHCYRSRIMNHIDFDGYLPFDFMGLRWYRGFCFWVILSIYPVSKLCFEYMACRKIFDKYYLISHLTTQCYSMRHTPVNIFAVIFLIAMLCYIPWRLVLFLKEHQHLYGDKESDFPAKWGFLYANVRPQVSRWFGLTLILQMVLMAPVYTMLPLLVVHETTYLAQLIWTCTIIGTMFFITLGLWVYRSQLQQIAQLVFYFACLYGSVLMYLMKTYKIDPSSADIMAYVFVALVGIGFILAFVVAPIAHHIAPLPLPDSIGEGAPVKNPKKKAGKGLPLDSEDADDDETFDQPLDIPELAADRADDSGPGDKGVADDVMTAFLQYPSAFIKNIVGDDEDAGTAGDDNATDSRFDGEWEGNDDDTVNSWIPGNFFGGGGGDTQPATNPDSVSLEFGDDADTAGHTEDGTL